MQKIGIVVLNWNNYYGTNKCVNYILPYFNNKFLDIELFLIDNNSSDGSGNNLYQDFNNIKDVYYIQAGFNGGYTRGNNFGIKKGIANNCDYLLILNNDLDINNIDKMIDVIYQVFKYNKQIGIIGFDVYNFETKKLLTNNGRVDKIFNYLLKIQENTISLDNYVSIKNKRDVCGCAICFRREMLEEIGIFDESFFMYAEEQDISLRAIKNNWSVVQICSEKFTILRKIDPISEKQFIWYYGTRNIFWVYRKNLQYIQKYVFISIQLLVYIKTILSLLLKGQTNIPLKIIQGIKDGLFSKIKKVNNEN